jgi:hypothetical protein
MVFWHPQVEAQENRKNASRALLAALRDRQQVVAFEQAMIGARAAGAQRVIVTHESPWHGSVPHPGAASGSTRVSRP